MLMILTHELAFSTGLKHALDGDLRYMLYMIYLLIKVYYGTVGIVYFAITMIDSSERGRVEVGGFSLSYGTLIKVVS